MTLAIARRARPAEAAIAVDFRRLFETECAYVWSTLRRLGVRSADLEDVCHDVFMTLHRHLHEYDPTRPLRPWLFRFAYRKASDYRSLSRHRHEELRETPDLPDGSPTPDVLVERHEQRSLVLEALDALELEKRAVLIMHEIDGCPMLEVATSLSIPLNTAYSRLRLARQEFARKVEKLSRRKQSP